MIGRLGARKVYNPDGTAYVEGIMEDVTEQKRAEEELKIKAQNLMEFNTALKVLLNTREKEQEDLKERILNDVKVQVLPYLEELKKTHPNGAQKKYIQLAESHLNGISSFFVQKLTSNYLTLTKKELEIASLVRDGKLSKEIAEILKTSTRTIDFYRGRIREKMGLKNKKEDLLMLLRSLS